MIKSSKKLTKGLDDLTSGQRAWMEEVLATGGCDLTKSCSPMIKKHGWLEIPYFQENSKIHQGTYSKPLATCV